MKSIAATEAREHFAELVHEVSERKQKFIIERRGKPCAVIIPLEDLAPVQGRVDQILHEGQQRLKDFAEASSDWFWEMDADGRYTYLSSRFTEVTGVPQEAILGKTREEIEIPGVDPAEWDKLLADMAARRSFRNFQHTRRHPDGRIVHLSISGKAIFDEAEIFRGYRGSGSDVTEYERTREALATTHDELEMRITQRTEELRRSNDRLRGEEAKLREILENSPVGVAITTDKKDESRAAGERLLVNSALIRMFGEIDRESFLKSHIEDSWVDLDQLAAVREILKGGGDLVDFEAQRRRKDGTTWWVSMNTRPIRLADQDCTMVWHFDITERKKAEDELRKNEALIRALIDHSPVRISIKDLDGRYVIINSAIEEFLGLGRDEVIGKTAQELNTFDDEYLEEIAALDKEVLRSGEVVRCEHQIKSPDGQTLSTMLIMFPILGPDGRPTGIGAMATDISERKEAEKRLRESEERLRQTTKLARIGYYVWDAVEDRCLFCSDEHARIHGISPDEFMARAASIEKDYTYTHPDDQDEYWRAMKDLRSGKPIEIEYRTVTATGNIYHIREIAEPVFDEAGRVVREIGASQNVTDIHHAEERLRQAQKMEAVGQLTGGVAHDFNNLLAVIMGNADLVEEQLGGDNKSAQAIIRAADRGAELTQRLLAFSRLQPLRSEEIDLEQLTHGMGHLLRRSLGETIEVGISSASGLWNALADHGQVESALLNLAINARDAMPNGGKLIIAATNETLDESHMASQWELSPGEYVVLSVSDTGIGMTPEVLEHVFEPFYTTKEVGEGSGLGLSMVYGFAKQSGGGVVIHSEPGHGTTVKIYLPRGGEVTVRVEPEKVAVGPLGHGELVLLVEDDPDVRTLTESMLIKLGYRVLVAEDAWVGIKALAAESPIDLMLSDVVLPGGMSGPDLAEHAISIDPGIKILFMSGYTEKVFPNQNPLPEGANLLSKPFRKSELAKRVQQALTQQPTDNPGRSS